MSQFRKTGVYYVSEWGGDPLNAGTDVAPFAHPANAPSSGGNLIIVGSGVYNGFWAGTRNIEGDGKVILDFLGAAAGNVQYYTGIIVRNATQILQSNSGLGKLHDCVLQNIPLIGRCPNSLRNLWVDGHGFNSNLNSQNVSNNDINIGSHFNSHDANSAINVAELGLTQYSFFSKNTKLYYISGLLINNLINSLIIISGVAYESKKLIDGSPRPDADPLIADIIDVIPAFYTDGNFSGDPKFIDVISRTVEPDSDLLRKSNANGFIGGVKTGQYINFQNSDFVITTQNIDTSNPDLLRIATGFDFGKLRITGKVSDTLISSQAVDIRIPFFFDSSEPGGDPLNNNVPDAVHGLRGLDTLGDLPYRLRFEVRSSQMPNASRFNNDEWDNDISGIAGRWYLMEYGRPMLHHIVASVAYGNADKFAINAPVKTPFNYRSLDIEITLSNDRSQV